MRNVPAIDATGMKIIKEVYRDSPKSGTTILLSGVHTQPLFALDQAGFLDIVGRDNIFGNIDDAIKRAEELLQYNNNQNVF